MGPFMLLWEWLTKPKSIHRDPEAQKKADAATSKMALYQFKTCPFCIKVRQATRRLALNIEFRDAQHDQNNRQQLLEKGGQIKVPCLKTVNEQGQEVWLYESSKIVDYLNNNFASES